MRQDVATDAAGVKPPADFAKPFNSKPGGKQHLRHTSHLIRRAAFGVPHDDLQACLKQPTDATLAALFDFEPGADAMADQLKQMEGLFYPFRGWNELREWWAFRMLNSPYPLQERLTVMWHNHFATSIRKVRNTDRMHEHLKHLRQHADGSFRDLLIEMSRDAAMLVWLDGHYSHKGSPNENYAREILELFTLGHGQYQEKDIQELARAFTGWRIHGHEGRFHKNRFDDTEKTIFGQTDNFDLESAVDLILAQPAAPRFIARRLLTEFVHPYPQDAHVEHYAKRLLHHKWQVRPVVREMLGSQLFYSDWAYRSRIKSPVTLVIGTLKSMGGQAFARFARESLERMGQELLTPPTVEGWPGHEEWINAATVIERFNFGMSAATNRRREFARAVNLHKFLAEQGLKEPEPIIDHFATILLDGQVADDQRQSLIDYMNRDKKNKHGEYKHDWHRVNEKVKGLVHLMTALPEYQLC